MIYDYVIIGSGPTGLSCAHSVNKAGHTCLVVDRESSPGGCHRVDRVNNLFSEHGPRIYSSGYLNFHSLLKDNDVDTKFSRYKFTITPSLLRNVDNTTSQALRTFSAMELWYLARCYVHCMIDQNYYLSRSVNDVFGHFSNGSLDYIDRICRLTDGAGSDRYTSYQFLQLINQNFLYEILQPSLPNDMGWVSQLVKSLKNKGVHFQMGTEATELSKNNGLYLLRCKNKTYTGKNIVFATPTDTLAKFFHKFNDINLSQYNKTSLYETYIPFTLHWNQKLDLKDIWGQGMGPWNIAWVVMSDYMDEPNTKGTLISCCISKLDTIGLMGKTANQCNYSQFQEEVLLQLKPLLREYIPDHFVMSPEVYYSNKQWKNRDTAYMLTPQNHNLKFPFKLKAENIYSVGTHNGHSSYSFTTAESSVQNALEWANKHVDGFYQKIITGWTLNYLIVLIAVCVFITFIVFNRQSFWPIITVLQKWLRWK